MIAIDVLLNIIRTEMGLAEDRVLIYNQKWILPNTQDIFVYLSFVSEVVYANNRSNEDIVGDPILPDGFYEIQTLNKSTLFDINIFSRDESAFQRKDEILLALKSTFAQQQSEEFAIKIAELPTTFNDLSDLEATARLNRYGININVFSFIQKEKIVDFYDTSTFETRRSL